LAAIFPPSSSSAVPSGNALVPISSHRHLPVSAGDRQAGALTVPARDRNVMQVSSAALPMAAHPGQLTGPARDLAAYRRADLLDAVSAGLGQIVNVLV
jgi:hypothetical protein